MPRKHPQVLGVDRNRPESTQAVLSRLLYGIDSELFGNDAHTGPPRSRQGLTDSFFECGGEYTRRLSRRLSSLARVKVGKAEALGVTVAVHRGNPFGDRVDGLLGMSFLSRFYVTLSPTGIELTAIPLR
jgi:hypothetical protein